MTNYLSYLLIFLKALKNDILTVMKATTDDVIPTKSDSHEPVLTPHHSIAKQTAPRHVIVA